MVKNNLLVFCNVLQNTYSHRFLIGKTHRIASVSLLSLLPLVANAEVLSLQQAVDKVVSQFGCLIFSQHSLVRIVGIQSNTAQIDNATAEQKYKPEWGVTLGYDYHGDDLSGIRTSQSGID